MTPDTVHSPYRGSELQSEEKVWRELSRRDQRLNLDRIKFNQIEYKEHLIENLIEKRQRRIYV
jgi:hypothetical protein